MRGWIVGALGAVALAAAGGAQAQPQVQGLATGAEGARLVLLCSGTDTVMVTSVRLGGSNTGYARTPAQLGVMLDKGAVRVRPPATTTYVPGKPEPDGWLVLEKPEVTEFFIRARSAGTALLGSKLDIDRRTGAATFGDFSGVCRAVTTMPSGTVF